MMADAICHNCRYFKGKAGGYGDCLIHDTTVHYGGSGVYCSCFKFKDDFNKDVKDSLKLQVVRISKDRDAKELPCGTLVVKGYSAYLVGGSNDNSRLTVIFWYGVTNLGSNFYCR